jgi:hypothetical protein
MIRNLLPLVVLLTLAACARDVAGPQHVAEQRPSHVLDVSITVEPGEVGQHEAFMATLRIVNPTDQTIRVVTGSGCLATPSVVRDGRRVPFRGSSWLCTAAITTHTFPPGAIRVLTWEMRAELYAEHPGDAAGAPAPSGVYRVQADFGTPVEDGSGRNPAAEASLRVR